MRKRTAMIVGGLLLAGALAPITAAQAATTTDVGIQTWAPDCVEVFGPPAVTEALLRNTCGNTQRVRVIIKHGFDSGCFVLDPGEEEVYDWTFGRYDGLKTC
jgi:hypothetical protein